MWKTHVRTAVHRKTWQGLQSNPPAHLSTFQLPRPRTIMETQTRQNEVKMMWKLKKAEILLVIVEATAVMKKTPYWVLKNHSWDYHYKRATSGGCVRCSVKILKRAFGRTRPWERSFTVWFMNHDPLLKNRRWRFWVSRLMEPSNGDNNVLYDFYFIVSNQNIFDNTRFPRRFTYQCVF